MEHKKEVLLRVENLSQYFGKAKAVDDVSFEIYKGEVFGLVGESGCGKTTTGRSVIKIYDITSGSIYFKGRRICAGTLEHRQQIREKQKEIKSLKRGSSPDAAQKIKACSEEIALLRAEIKAAKFDQKYADREYAKALVSQVEEKYRPLLANASGEERMKLRKEYEAQRRAAKKARLLTQIQMIFQDPIASLDPRMTVKEIIAEGLVIGGVQDKAYITNRVYEMLSLVGLVQEHAARYPHEFSGGQRQRIGIARSLIMQPELLIADEPVSALDVSVQAQVINLLNELRESLDLTILFIAHDLSVVKYFSDRIGVMYYGKLVELAPSEELFAHPLHPYTKALLSAIPLPDPQSEKNRKRIMYHAESEHDYRQDKPSLREICPEHFIYCNDGEESRYRKELGL